ncbi:hypothetical protein JCM10207_005353 [Rhodosporidiobolus poonsookiae]
MALDLPLRSFQMQWKGGGRQGGGEEWTLGVDEGRMEVKKAETALLKWGEGEVLEACFVSATPIDGEPTSLTLFLTLSEVSTNVPGWTMRASTIALELGGEMEENGALERLKERVEGWGKEVGFEVKVDGTGDSKVLPTRSRSPLADDEPSPKRPRRRSSSVSSFGPPRPPDSPVKKSTPPRGAGQGSEEPRGARPDPRTRFAPVDGMVLEGEKATSVWDYISNEPAIVEWHPGFYARQYAFISAIDPRMPFDTIDFNDDEARILSCNPRRTGLPCIPQTYDRNAPPFSNWERLAVEHIYHHWQLSLEDLRRILDSPDYPLLGAYARVLAKIIAARDCLVCAYERLLEDSLYPRSCNPSTVDPVDKIIPLIVQLRDKQTPRKEVFSVNPFMLVKSSPFRTEDIGIGPARRFEQKLKAIVEYEEKLFKDFERPTRKNGGKRG